MPRKAFASRLRQRVEFQRKVPAAGFASAGQEPWAPVITVAAELQDLATSRDEQAVNGLTIAKRRTRIRIRYRTDITADMRILAGDRVMQIVAGPADLDGREGFGRREALELIAEDYSTAGGQA